MASVGRIYSITIITKFMDTDSEIKWYILYTMPQHEKKVATLFQKKGWDYYLPLVKRKRQWSDRVKIVEFPLFPGYIFTHINWFTQRVPILEFPGALQYVRKEGAPAVMPDEQIENLKLFVVGAQAPETEPDENFPVGQRVRVNFGVLKNVEGVVSGHKSKKRIYIRLPLINQMVSTEIDVMDLERLE